MQDDRAIASISAGGCCCTFDVGLRVHLLPGHPGSFGKGLQVVPRLDVDDAVQVVFTRRAENGCAGRGRGDPEVTDGKQLSGTVGHAFDKCCPANWSNQPAACLMVHC